MQINLKSNKSFILKIFVPIAVILALCVIFMGITLTVEYDKDLLTLFIIFCVFTAVYIAAILTVYFWKGKRYEFTETEIICYKRDKESERINISDIHLIKFYKFKLYYIIPVCMMEVESGGCWSLHVWKKDGTKKVLRFFSVKQAKMLKEQLFGESLTII